VATDNPVVGEIVCDEHDYGPEKALVKLSLKKNRLYVHCPGCGLKQQTLPPFQGWIKKHAVFYPEYQQMYGDGKKYEGGGKPEPEADPVPEPENVQETKTPAAKKQPQAEPQKVKKPGLLSRLGKALAEEE
jgi:hypothetical protein